MHITQSQKRDGRNDRMLDEKEKTKFQQKMDSSDFFFSFM